MADEPTGGTPPGNPPAPAPAPHPDLTKPPAKEGDPPRMTWVPPDVWSATNERLRALEAEKAENERKAELENAERLKQEAIQGGFEKQMTEVRTLYDRTIEKERKEKQELLNEWLGEKKVTIVTDVLSAYQFVGKTPEAKARTQAMVRRLLLDEIEATRGSDGKPVIRDKTTFRPAAEYLRSRLDDPESEFAELLAPQTRGGSGTDGTRSPANPQPLPAQLSPDAVVQAWQDNKGYTPGIGLSAVPK